MSDSSSASGPTSGEWRARLEAIRDIARRLSPDRETAEEAEGELALKMVGSRVPIRHLPAWAFRALRHLIARLVQQRQARQPAEKVEPDALPARESTGIFLGILVDEVLSQVRPAHAQILRLYREGLSQREIAQRLGFPEAQVGARLARAQRAARKARGAVEEISPTSEYKRPSKSLYRQ